MRTTPEDLEWVVYGQGQSAPAIAVDVEDADGDVDLSTGWSDFEAKFIRGADVVLTLSSVTGTTTGFEITVPVGGLDLDAGDYEIQCSATRNADGRVRRGKALLHLTTGF